MRTGLVKAAGAIAALTVVSKLLGFIRETSLAAVFGVKSATDAYLVGQTIPALIFSLVGAALGTTFIPVYAQAFRERGREGAFAMATTVINAVALATLGIIAGGEVLAGPLTRLVAPGFRSEVYDLTVHLTRIMFPMVFFQGLSGLLTGMLQTEDNFLVPASIGLWFNGFIIASIVFLGPRYGIIGVAAGLVAAAAAQLAVQVPALAKLGYRWSPRLDWRESGLRRMLGLSLPVLIGTSAGQLNAIVDRMLASGLAEGSVAALNYANRLMTLVPSVLGTAIVTVIYPTLAKLSVADQRDRYTSTFAQAVKLVNFVMLPVMAGMMVLSVPLVRLAFERGAFTVQATQMTVVALFFYAPAVASLSLRDLASRAFYAFQDTSAPMITGLVAVGLNVALNLALVGPMKQGGLALATSLSMSASTVLLLWTLRRRLKTASGGQAKGIGGRAILDSLWRVVLASLVMGAAVWAARGWLEERLAGRGVAAQGLRLGAAAGLGVVVYAALVLALRVPEAQLVLELGRVAVRRGWAKVRELLGASRGNV